MTHCIKSPHTNQSHEWVPAKTYHHEGARTKQVKKVYCKFCLAIEQLND